MSDKAEVKRIADVITRVILKIDHGKELDKTLNVYTSARGMFINLD